jgi:hypothetical protein
VRKIFYFFYIVIVVANLNSSAEAAVENQTYSCVASFPKENDEGVMKASEEKFKLSVTEGKIEGGAGVHTNVGSITVSLMEEMFTISVQASTGDGAATIYSVKYPTGTPTFSTRFEVLNLKSDKRAEGRLDCKKNDR